MVDINQSSATGVSADPAKAGLPGGIPVEDWKQKTAAQLLNETDFLVMKDQQGLHVVGVTGFSGQWSEAKIAADAGLKDAVTAATAALSEYLSDLKSRYGDKLVISSGATNEGVPKIIYDLCEALEIKAMGVTSAKAYDYPLGKMAYLIVMGADWGEESPTFLNTSDEFIMLGGGGQAKKEAIAASASGKSIAIFQGYGGKADELKPEEVPTGTFVARH